jgi:hypothetical protein
MLDGYGSIINTKKLTIPTISYCPELLFYIELLNLYVFLNTLPFFGGSYFETIPQRRDLTTFKKLSNLWPYLATTSFWVATPLSVITSTM